MSPRRESASRLLLQCSMVTGEAHRPPPPPVPLPKHKHTFSLSEPAHLCEQIYQTTQKKRESSVEQNIEHIEPGEKKQAGSRRCYLHGKRAWRWAWNSLGLA